MAFSDVDVEEVFSDFVEYYGGIVSDRVPHKGNKLPNADFIFDEAKVVAELKLLKDPRRSKDFRQSLRKKQNEWLQKGYITPFQLRQVTKIKQLPDRCRQDIEKLYTRAIRTHVEKANQQIKSTRKTPGLENHKGLLFIVSDGNYLLNPTSIRTALAHFFANPTRFRSINTVVYLTVNSLTVRAGDPTLSRLWVQLYRDRKHFDQVSLDFLADLYEKWATYFSSVTGIPIYKIYEMNEDGITEEDVLNSTRFVDTL